MAVQASELVPLGIAAIQVTRLCFGTGTLFRLHASRERQRLLDAAYDLGIRHFDTARSYGLGDAEREVGRFVARHRNDVTVATKFGMRLSRTGSLLKPLQTAARRVVGMFPGLRKQLRRRRLPIIAPRSFDPATAKDSLTTSLRELAVERIDILFLHEPDAQTPIDPALADWLAQARDDGVIRAWGLSGPLAAITAVREQSPALAAVMQYGSDAVARTTGPTPPPGPRLTYSPFANALDQILTTLVQSTPAANDWQSRLDLPAAKGAVAELLLADCCAEPNRDPIVFSTTSVRHLESLARAAYDPGMLARVPEFRKWIAAHLSPSGLTIGGSASAGRS
jgi:D-threo-aldose 1-dehydrogenase